MFKNIIQKIDRKFFHLLYIIESNIFWIFYIFFITALHCVILHFKIHKNPQFKNDTT